MLKTVMLMLVAGLVLAACGGTPAPTGQPPVSGGSPAATAVDPGAVKNVEKYLEAKIKGDEATLRALMCAAMEKNLALEVTTFLGTSGVELQDMACQFDGVGKVACTGKIVADYGQEKNEFPLGTYSVVQEDGEWKYCGEAE